MQLVERRTSVPIHNKISNIVGPILIGRPHEQLRIRDVHEIVESLYPKRYTEGQVRKGLEWQTQNNGSVIKTKKAGHDNKTRLYWYEATDNI